MDWAVEFGPKNLRREKASISEETRKKPGEQQAQPSGAKASCKETNARAYKIFGFGVVSDFMASLLTIYLLYVPTREAALGLLF